MVERHSVKVKAVGSWPTPGVGLPPITASEFFLDYIIFKINGPYANFLRIRNIREGKPIQFLNRTHTLIRVDDARFAISKELVNFIIAEKK